ncbi:MAG: hypothetical protein J0L88_13360 [Xanthomonadales bacterium]|nr:hypothetical protein [Xanthomonadales bacterium]
MTPSRILACLLAGSGIGLHAHAAVYTVGADAACQYTSIQQAIDAAKAHAGTDFVRVARSATWSGVELDINGHDIVLAGGYASCGAGTPAAANTELVGDDNSVVRIRGSGDVVLMGLTLRGGHEPRSATGFGGGIDISGGPHLVSLTDVIINQNDAGRGGGISVRNTISGDPGDVVLVLSDDVLVMNNQAGFPLAAGVSGIEGGGIYCNEASLRITGGGLVSITGNSADHDGGGLGIEECDVVIAPRGTTNLNGIVLNSAGRDGGGIAVAGASGGGTRLYTALADRPVQLSGNIAAREGGGIKINTHADVRAWGLVLDENRAADGGGVSLFTDAGDDTRFEMRASTSGAPTGAVRCAAGLHCASISGNRAVDDEGVRGQGAALRIKANGDIAGNAEYRVRLDGVRIESNEGLNAIRGIDSGSFSFGQIVLNGSVLAGNRVANELLFAESRLDLSAVTIGANAISGANVIRSASIFGVDIVRSVIWQPGVRVLLSNDSGSPADSFLYNIASDFTGIPGSPTNVIVDPHFVDAGAGDLHLTAGSPGVDFAPPTADTEADGLPRSIDLGAIDNRFGPQDVGAYERQFGDDRIFRDDFEYTP